MARDLTSEVSRLRQEIKEIKRGQRYAHGGSIENNALEVRDGSGSLRAIVGVQSDGTTGLNVVNGPPPPTPSAPILGSVLGGITVSWNGGFADGTVPPLDWQRTEVHASTIDGFTPALETLKTTFETPQGGTVVVPCEEPVYVLLVARNTSGTASPPTVQAGPLGPAPVVATDILDGIVTTLKLADDAVTTAKLAAGAVDTVALADNAVLDTKLADNAVKVGKIADNAVTGPAIASDAVTAGKIAADAVTAREIAAGSVTAAEIAAGAVTAEKLTIIGGSNLLSDPSFEGAYTAAQLAGLAYASQDTTMGNGSPTSIKIDCVASTPSTFQVPVTNVPVLPGDQLYLAVDYWVSTDWNGGDINFQVRWEDAAGTRLTFGKAITSSPVRETWTRMSATLPAPANAANAKIRLESAGTTLGTVRFDNAAVRPVVGGVQIADGAISTPKLVAGAVQALQIDAGAVNADKIASGAVTTGKLDALAVTSDKIAANAITAGKILAGAVDATALAADAITGKTITGGVINGTTITGGLIQTATSGERIAINELGQNKAIVYDSTGAAVGEFSYRGLRLRGDAGALIIVDPDATYPNLRFTNAANTSNAVISTVESTAGTANLGLNTGTFTASGFTDMKWRTYMGEDFAVMERIREADVTTIIGGRVDLRNNSATLGYYDASTTGQSADIVLTPALAKVRARTWIQPSVGDSNSVLFLQPGPSHTGAIIRYWDPDTSQYRFQVDKDGTTTISGKMTAGNMATGKVTITPTTANVPASTTVTGLNVKGGPLHAYVSPVTSAPGTVVRGVSATSVTSGGMVIWVTRTDTGNTDIHWMLTGE